VDGRGGEQGGAGVDCIAAGVQSAVKGVGIDEIGVAADQGESPVGP